MLSIKQSRCASFAVITAVYLFAAVCGIAAYRRLPFSWWLNLLLADVFATVVTFAFSVWLKNASVYDPYWSVQPVVILAAFALGRRMSPTRLLLLIVVSVWGIRLTANWAYTFGGLLHQDWRYTMLREQTGVFYPLINLVGIHLVPTLIVYACLLPAVYAFVYELEFTALSIVCCALSLAAATMQGIADAQMHRFRRRKTGGFIRDGLWKYSRHPNYLGEIVMWWGIALSVVAAKPSVWYLAVGAVSNTLLFFTVSIPMADRRQSRKPGFDAYRAQTHRLLPIKCFGAQPDANNRI